MCVCSFDTFDMHRHYIPQLFWATFDTFNIQSITALIVHIEILSTWVTLLCIEGPVCTFNTSDKHSLLILQTAKPPRWKAQIAFPPGRGERPLYTEYNNLRHLWHEYSVCSVVKKPQTPLSTPPTCIAFDQLFTHALWSFINSTVFGTFDTSDIKESFDLQCRI